MELICSLGKFFYSSGDHTALAFTGCSVWTSYALFADFKLLLTYIIQNTGFEFPLVSCSCCFITSVNSFNFFKPESASQDHHSESGQATLCQAWYNNNSATSQIGCKTECCAQTKEKKKSELQERAIIWHRDCINLFFLLLCSLSCFIFKETESDFNKRNNSCRPLLCSEKRALVTIFSVI